MHNALVWRGLRIFPDQKWGVMGVKLEPVVAAAVHDEKPALVDDIEDGKAIGKDVVNALNIVVGGVAVALVGEHVVRAAVDDGTAEGLFHGGGIGSFQVNVRSRDGRLFVEHDVVTAGGGQVVHAFDVDDLGEQNEIEYLLTDFETGKIKVVLIPDIEADIVGGVGRENRRFLRSRRSSRRSCSSRCHT